MKRILLLSLLSTSASACSTVNLVPAAKNMISDCEARGTLTPAECEAVAIEFSRSKEYRKAKGRDAFILFNMLADNYEASLHKRAQHILDNWDGNSWGPINWGGK